MTAPVFATLGCRLNAYETEAMKGLAEAAGRRATRWWSTAAPSPPRRCARRGSRSAGCGATTRRRASSSPAARRRPSPRPSRRCPRSTWCSATPRSCGPRPGRGWRAAARRGSRSATSWPRRRPAAPLIDGLGTRARAYVQVQNGCDHRCTFCIIPYGRGNSRSVPAATVVAQVARLRRPRLQRGGADRRRPDELGRRPRGRAAARRPRRGGAAPACRTCRGCGSPRSTRSRPTRGWSRRSAASRG